jgi:hypothetical protein
VARPSYMHTYIYTHLMTHTNHDVPHHVIFHLIHPSWVQILPEHFVLRHDLCFFLKVMHIADLKIFVQRSLHFFSRALLCRFKIPCICFFGHLSAHTLSVSGVYTVALGDISKILIIPQFINA